MDYYSLFFFYNFILLQLNSTSQLTSLKTLSFLHIVLEHVSNSMSVGQMLPSRSEKVGLSNEDKRAH